MTKRLPVIIQTVVYKHEKGGTRFLYLKRSLDRGGFWSAVNGTLKQNESVMQCAIRELREETGIINVGAWSEELHRFSFDYKGTIMTVLVIAAEVGPEISISLNNEHTEYLWAGFEEALKILKFDDDKDALRICHAFIQEKVSG